MHRRIVSLIVIIVCSLVVILGIGIKTKKSIVNDTDLYKYLENEELKVENYEYITNSEHDVYKSYQDIEKLSEMEKISEVIVKVSVDNEGKRLIYDGCVLTDCKVEEVYKGKIKNNTIAVFEPVECNYNDIISCANGYNLMNDKDEYILFLTPVEGKVFESESDIYVLTTIVYSKYDVSIEDKATIFDEDLLYGEILYRECEENEVLLSSSEAYEEAWGYENNVYQCFYNLKEQVVKKYK